MTQGVFVRGLSEKVSVRQQVWRESDLSTDPFERWGAFRTRGLAGVAGDANGEGDLAG